MVLSKKVLSLAQRSNFGASLYTMGQVIKYGSCLFSHLSLLLFIQLKAALLATLPIDLQRSSLDEVVYRNLPQLPV